MEKPPSGQWYYHSTSGFVLTFLKLKPVKAEPFNPLPSE